MASQTPAERTKSMDVIVFIAQEYCSWMRLPLLIRLHLSSLNFLSYPCLSLSCNKDHVLLSGVRCLMPW